MIDLVAAEWLKLRTTRLLHGMIPAATAISLAAVAGTVLSAADAGALESTEGIREVFGIAGAGVILVLVIGIIISAGEHRHGTAADTFLTTPRRHLVLAAKLAVGAGVGLAAGAVIAVACVGVAVLLYNVKGANVPFDDVEVWLALAGMLVYATLFAVVGVAFGSLVRNQTLAVAGALAWFAIIEHTLVNLVPDVGRWLPAAAGEAILRAPLDGLLSPLAGTALLATYGAVIAVAGIRVEATRDA